MLNTTEFKDRTVKSTEKVVAECRWSQKKLFGQQKKLLDQQKKLLDQQKKLSAACGHGGKEKEYPEPGFEPRISFGVTE